MGWARDIGRRESDSGISRPRAVCFSCVNLAVCSTLCEAREWNLRACGWTDHASIDVHFQCSLHSPHQTQIDKYHILNVLTGCGCVSCHVRPLSLLIRDWLHQMGSVSLGIVQASVKADTRRKFSSLAWTQWKLTLVTTLCVSVLRQCLYELLTGTDNAAYAHPS